MRKIIVNEFMSLDGVIQGPGGPEEDTSNGFALGGWTAPLSDASTQKAIGERMQQEYDLLLGRFTYDIWAAYWPFQNGPMADKFNGIKKYVATQTLQQASWEGTVLLNGDTIAAVKELKNSDGPDLQMWGSANFIQSLLQHQLIDRLHLMIFPLALGTGKKLFAGGLVPGSFKLTQHTVSSTGVIMATYEPNGEVLIGHAGKG